jgi:hypothetical protein
MTKTKEAQGDTGGTEYSPDKNQNSEKSPARIPETKPSTPPHRPGFVDRFRRVVGKAKPISAGRER